MTPNLIDFHWGWTALFRHCSYAVDSVPLTKHTVVALMGVYASPLLAMIQPL